MRAAKSPPAKDELKNLSILAIRKTPDDGIPVGGF
jgi:hypothetical protein